MKSAMKSAWMTVADVDRGLTWGLNITVYPCQQCELTLALLLIGSNGGGEFSNPKSTVHPRWGYHNYRIID